MNIATTLLLSRPMASLACRVREIAKLRPRQLSTWYTQSAKRAVQRTPDESLWHKT